MNNKKFTFFILGFLFCLNLIAWIVIYDLDRSKFLEVVFFNVGQGDSIFIETPQGHQVLIDGGPGLIVLEKLAAEMSFYDKTIDLIILTHPERDHLFGLLEVLKRYKVENILWTGVVRETAEWGEWERLIKEEGAEIKIAEAGDKIVLSEDIYLHILYPFKSLEGEKVKNSNDTSVVVELIFDDISFLFTGDITKKIEKQLIVDSDVLKVAHHGSRTSSSSEFLQTVSPRLAVITVGENSYGHPHPEVLARLKEFDIDTLRTDKNGDIKIISDGSNFKLE